MNVLSGTLQIFMKVTCIYAFRSHRFIINFLFVTKRTQARVSLQLYFFFSLLSFFFWEGGQQSTKKAVAILECEFLIIL